MNKMSDTGRKLKIFAATVAVVLLVGFFVVHHLKSREQGNLESATSKNASACPIVNVVAAQNSPSSLPLTLPGETAAWYESIIYARVDGYVARWNSDIGDHVQKGQILATIETPELDAQLAAAQAKLKAAQALVVSRQADAEFAKTTHERWRDSPKGVVSDWEREAKKAGYDSAVAQLNAAQAQVGLDRADVDRYVALTQFKQVTAPYQGTITERRIDIGNLVTAGSSANTTPLYRMVRDDPIRVFVDVPQSAAGDIKVDTPVQISASNIADRVFDGKVTRTAGAINSKTRTLRVEIDIPNLDHALVPGMYINSIFLVPTTGLVQIPAAALVFRSGGPQVAIVDKDNKVNFNQVVIARDNGNTVEISSGVSSGDAVILNVGSQILEGGTVEAHETSKDYRPNAPAQKQ
ncbi:MAG: efflux RND transporter periplasmic adaptor subunit [Syntrophobacteraceae bacterium]